jgi:hypothetical protein
MVSGKCSDMCHSRFKNKDRNDYAPRVEGLEGGDYISLKVCLECGQVQGEWPQPDPEEFETDEDNESEEW